MSGTTAMTFTSEHKNVWRYDSGVKDGSQLQNAYVPKAWFPDGPPDKITVTVTSDKPTSAKKTAAVVTRTPRAKRS